MRLAHSDEFAYRTGAVKLTVNRKELDVNSAPFEYQIPWSQGSSGGQSSQQQLQLPSGAELLGVLPNMQNNQITLLAEVDPEPSANTETRNFVVFSTGDPMPVSDWKLAYVGSALASNGQPQHLYEIIGQT